MGIVARGLVAGAIAALSIGASAAQEAIERPAYDEVGNALIVPFGDFREKRAGLVRISLDDFSLSPVPMPCGHYPALRVAFFDQGRTFAVMAAQASKPANLEPGNSLLPEEERYWQPYDLVFLRQSDWSVVRKIDVDKPSVIPDKPRWGREESVVDISAPDRGRTLYLSVDFPVQSAAPRAIYGLSSDDWQMKLLWPTKSDFHLFKDDSFLNLSAPDWIEDGHWVVRGQANPRNKQWKVPYSRQTHTIHWLINPADQSVREHPHSRVLHQGFTVQKVDGGIYTNVITKNSGGNATYALKRLVPEPAQIIGPLGDEIRWMYMFSGRGKQYVATASRDGRFALRALPDLRELPIDTGRFGEMVNRWACENPWNP